MVSYLQNNILLFMFTFVNLVFFKRLPYPTPPRRVTHRKDLPCLDHEENVEVIWPAPDYIIKKSRNKLIYRKK